jgi:hypothetical protein
MNEIRGAIPPDVLLKDAHKAASQLGFSIDPTFSTAFLDAVSGHWQEPNRKLEDAQASTNRLITEAVNIARLQGKQSLDADVFKAVLAKEGFCPLWPFC